MAAKEFNLMNQGGEIEKDGNKENPTIWGERVNIKELAKRVLEMRWKNNSPIWREADVIPFLNWNWLMENEDWTLVTVSGYEWIHEDIWTPMTKEELEEYMDINNIPKVNLKSMKNIEQV